MNKDIELVFKKRFEKYFYEMLENNELKKSVVADKKEMQKKIKKYVKYLTMFEINMLNTLNEFCLLLDIREVIDVNNRVFIEAYNIDNECIMRKESGL